MIADTSFRSDQALAVLGATEKQFPALEREVDGHAFVYLDSAATALRPESVIDAGCQYCRRHDGNPHRGMYAFASEATAVYEGARARVAHWIDAGVTENVVITRNATAALNLVARGIEHRLNPGDEIVLTEMEHHANLVPWLTLAKRKGLRIRYLKVDDNGLLDLSALDAVVGPRTRVVSFVHVSNVLGTINPVAPIVEAARKVGALTVLDAAQSVGHQPLSFKTLGVDFMAFSAHKCYGPMGLGFLVGQSAALAQLEPLETGGDMIEQVSYEAATWASIPHRFEAGTANAAAVAAFVAALDFIDSVGLETIRYHDQLLVERLIDALDSLGGVRLLGPRNSTQRGGLLAFVDARVHAHDLATILDQRGIAVRAGHHCAQPLHKKLGLAASARASFGVYSKTDDVDALVDGISFARKVFGA